MKSIIISMFTILLSTLGNNTSFKIKKNEKIEKPNEQQTNIRQNAAGSDYIDTNIEDAPYACDQVSFTISVISDNTIIDSNASSSGMELLSQLTFDENKEATLNYVVSDLQSSSTIYVNLVDNKSLTLSIYAVNTDYGVFLNTDSYEMAKENYYVIELSILNI